MTFEHNIEIRGGFARRSQRHVRLMKMNELIKTTKVSAEESEPAWLHQSICLGSFPNKFTGFESPVILIIG